MKLFTTSSANALSSELHFPRATHIFNLHRDEAIEQAGPGRRLRRGGGEEVHGVVVDPAAPLQGCAEQAVEEQAEESAAPANGEDEQSAAKGEGFRQRRRVRRAAAPASVPAMLMAPSRPGSTCRMVVIMRGRPPSTWPNSEETVSAAASASAARPSAKSSGGANQAVENQWESMSDDCTTSLQASAATPRLAATWEAVRPWRFSAVPMRTFCSRPTRVAKWVSRKTASTGTSADCQGR